MSSSSHPGAPPTPEQLAAALTALAVERQREAALGLYARRMTHDMSNFVTVIRTYSELLLGDMPPDAPARSDVQEIYRAADAIVDYLHRVARFARSGSARPGIVQVDDVLRDVLSQFRAVPDRECVSISSDLNCRASALVDASWLADAVREVLVNACEASAPDGAVRVRSWDTTLDAPLVDAGVPVGAGHWVVIEVADNGAGFSPEVRLQAADPFVTTKAGVRGAGFGLTLARGVAWQSGGQLVCADGEAGTRVRFWFPVARPAA